MMRLDGNQREVKWLNSGIFFLLQSPLIPCGSGSIPVGVTTLVNGLCHKKPLSSVIPLVVRQQARKSIAGRGRTMQLDIAAARSPLDGPEKRLLMPILPGRAHIHVPIFFLRGELLFPFDRT
jgi:hypothetical protein